MKAIKVTNEGKKMEWGSVPTPDLPNNHALVNVHAAGVNRADILQKKGHYPPPPSVSHIIGLEIAGTIAKIKGSNKGWQVNDRIMALLPGGGYATQAIVPTNMLLPIPRAISFTEAAAIPEAIYTAYLNLIRLAELQYHETVLIHAGAGGIGSTVIQLAQVGGGKVIATAGTEQKLSFCKQLGADHALSYKEDTLASSICKAAPDGIDIVIDPVGGSRYAKLNAELLNKYGRWILIGLLGGLEGQVNLGKILKKNLRLFGSTLRYRSNKEKSALTKSILKEIIPLYNDKQLRPVVDNVFPVQEADRAHTYMLQNKVKGKLVLKIDGENR